MCLYHTYYIALRSEIICRMILRFLYRQKMRWRRRNVLGNVHWTKLGVYGVKRKPATHLHLSARALRTAAV